MDFAFHCAAPEAPNGRSAAVIGAGPSGLAAAGFLACRGYRTTVYDKLPRPGGLLLFGIPGARIPRERVEAGVRRMEREFGVVFRGRTKICCSAPLREEEGDHFCRDVLGLGDLVRNHDAVMICTGSWRSRRLDVPGEDLPGVFTGLEFLFPIRAARYCAPNVSVPDVSGKNVIVVGAGHSAVDVADSALALGAASVTMLYRRTIREAPCGACEIERLRRGGVGWLESVVPLRILGDEGVEGLEIRSAGAGAGLAEGERRVVAANVVVAAIGEIATPPFARELGLENVRRGEVRWLHMTALENVFVAGDALTGPSKIGRAVYSGLRAARSLANWLDLKALGQLDRYPRDDFVVNEDEAQARRAS